MARLLRAQNFSNIYKVGSRERPSRSSKTLTLCIVALCVGLNTAYGAGLDPANSLNSRTSSRVAASDSKDSQKDESGETTSGNTTSYNKPCVSGATTGSLAAAIPGLLMIFIDGGITLMASIPIILKGAVVGCLVSVAGRVAEDSVQ